MVVDFRGLPRSERGPQVKSTLENAKAGEYVEFVVKTDDEEVWSSIPNCLSGFSPMATFEAITFSDNNQTLHIKAQKKS
jgi:TusA-related sulfurtransferase